MQLTIRLEHFAVRILLIVVVTGVCYGLTTLVQQRYAINDLASRTLKAPLSELLAASERHPHSAKTQARLAVATLTQVNDLDEYPALAEAAAQRAVQLSPHDVRNWLLLAATQSVTGDMDAQETHLRKALSLAPHDPQIRWQFANLLVRAGKLELSLPEFREALNVKPNLLPTALSLLWEASNENPASLEQAVGESPRNRLAFAGFLLDKERLVEASQVFSRIDTAAKLPFPDTPAFLNKLMNKAQAPLARRLWGGMRGESGDNVAPLWNGGFEAAALPNLSHFDWQLKRSAFATAKIEQGQAHTGIQALRIDFAGRDTTKLSDEAKQLLVLQPNTAYRLTCFVKTAKFVTPEGPRWVLLNQANSQSVAQTHPINAEAAEWQPLTMDFTTPSGQSLYWLALQRTPKFSYDEPTKGTLWFDDFAVTQIAGVTNH